MSVDVICPECGGVIGGVGYDAQGRGPCTCFDDRPTKKSKVEKADSSDTVSIPSIPAPVTTTMSPQRVDANEAPEKLCIVCGKNVSGHRRIKDSRGYLCLDCAKAEMAQEKAGTVPCAECGRRIKEGGLVMYSGIKICRRCYVEHKESKKVLVRKVATKNFDAHERRTVLIWAILFLILGSIVVYTQLRH
jgi:hypothetical protein